MDQIEILAPAGSFETMKAAYKAGADAVYMGGQKFGARAYADNAATDEMLQAIDYAHLHGRRLYLTVNTLLKNTEIEKELFDYLKPFYEQGLDAVIVQDLGVMDLIHTYFPGMDIHASTQMTVCGTEYGQWLAKRGATRIVTPRELDLSEIAAMKRATGLEIETFVHGALCYCYSGQCLMSSMIGGRSGNRGRCAQPCRLPWRFEGDNGEKSGYLLSPKDLCSLASIPELLEAGIDSLKIEGRMKKPEYAAMTTALYRKYADLYLEHGKQNFKVDQSDIEALMDLYNRGGFTKGYFTQHNGQEMMSTKRPNHSGLLVGKASLSKNGSIQIHAQRDINPGDILELPNEVSVKIDKSVKAGSDLKVKYTGKPFKKALPVMRTRNEMLISQVTEEYVKNYALKEKITGNVYISKGLPARIELDYLDEHLSVEGNVVSEASNRPLTEAEVRKRLLKTGQTPFIFEELNVYVEDGCYMAIQDLNQLRREALLQLEEKVLMPYRRHTAFSHINPVQEDTMEAKETTDMHVLISNLEQLRVVLESSDVRRIYFNDEEDDEIIKVMVKEAHDKGCDFYIAMPYIMRNETIQRYKQRQDILNLADGFLVRNMETILMLRALHITKPYIADYNLYSMNDRAASIYSKEVDTLTLPLELNRKELANLQEVHQSEMIVYGYTPLMVSAQCLLKTTDRCTKKPSIHMMEDRKHKHFPVKNVCAFCYNLIYNSVPLHLIDAIVSDKKLIRPASIRLQFLNESPLDVKKIVTAYAHAIKGEQFDLAVKDYTKGHYQRGIE